MMMPAPSSPETLDRIPAPVVRRWMMKAALRGFFAGAVAGIAALVN